MVKVIGAMVLGIISAVCFVISFLQFNEKGFLFNNAYIGASKQEKETMDKKPHYKQSGIVFALIGIIFLINTVEIIFQTKWLFYFGTAVEFAVVVYAIVSSIAIEKQKK